MKILSTWLRSYLPDLAASDQQLADDLTLRGIAVDGVFDLGPGNGSLLEMDITTNRVDAMNHYGIAREAAAIYDIPLKPLEVSLPAAKTCKAAVPRSHRGYGPLRPLHCASAARRKHRPFDRQNRAALLPARTKTHQQRRRRNQLRHHGHRSSNPCLRPRQTRGWNRRPPRSCWGKTSSPRRH